MLIILMIMCQNCNQNCHNMVRFGEFTCIVNRIWKIHLNKFEWLELEAYTKGGLIKNLESALETNNAKKTIDLLKKIILRAYGEKDPETGSFEKNDDLAIRFSKTEAFSELFYELAYNEKASKEFFIGLIPPEVRDQTLAEMEKTPKLTALPGGDQFQE